MKKLRQNLAKKDKKKESNSKKRGHNSPESKDLVKRRRVVEEICRDELPKIEQPNQEEMHVFIKGQILRFFINEFSLITGLNCFGNVDDLKYEDSSPSRLMKKYFPQSINGVDKEALVERFLKENFKNKEDALQMAILYFIHTFIYSQLNASPVLFSDFKMVEDGKYQFFPWGKVSFSRLMASLRQEFSMEKQLYRLVGIPQVLNVWMFELCSNVEPKVAVKEGNNIPLILNWKYSYANIVPIADEFEKLDLARIGFASEQHDMEEKSKVDADSISTLNRKDLVVKADLHSLEFEMKAYMKTYETIEKQSRQECDPSNAVVDDAEPTSTDSVVKETDKSVEMDDDKANQAPSFSKKGEQQDVGIEKQSDIAVEEIQPLESIIPGREHDLALTIYKPPPTTPAEYEISDTVILSAFSTPQKNVSANKNAPAPPSRKSSKIYRSHFLTCID
ncbi:hypothetical protein BC332_13837 [Capsicum chinense]|nr:hypothetical protein BC332_13837 [Capsicum chinense]